MTRSDLLKRILWAIQLTQNDFGEMKDGDWLNCKDELYDFFTEEIHWSLGHDPKALTNDDVEAMAFFIREAKPTDDNDHVNDGDCVDQVLALANKNRKAWRKTLRKEDAKHIQEGLRLFLSSLQIQDYDDFVHYEREQLLYGLEWAPSGNDLAMLAPPRLLLYLIAAGVEKNQIRTCAQCNRLFLATRKPRTDKKSYCNVRCAQASASREYRKRLGDKLRTQERDRGHRRYVTKQQRRYGPNTKVGRRPRKRR